MSQEPGKETSATIPQFLSPSSPWAHFLATKSCVCVQTWAQWALPTPAGPRTQLPLENSSLYGFLTTKQDHQWKLKSSQNRGKAYKNEKVQKRLERYPKITIVIISGIRCGAPANLIPAALQIHHLPSSSTAPTSHLQAMYYVPSWLHIRTKTLPSFAHLGSTLLGKCLFICDVRVQKISPSTLLELKVIFYPASNL